MAIVCRWITFLCLFLSFVPGALGDNVELRAFNAAADAFRGAFYQRADQEFAAFAAKYPNSPRLAEAELLRAQARLKLTNYAGALEVLKAAKPAAGALADRYLFWMAEAHFAQGELQPALEFFQALRVEHPKSSRLLEAVIRESAVRARLGEWPRVVELLGGTNGVLSTSGASTNALMQQGYLLLARSQLALKQYGATEATLGILAPIPLAPALDWERYSLLVQMRSGAGSFDQALIASTNLLKLGASPADPKWRPESIVIHARLLEKLGRKDEAYQQWQQNLASGLPAEYQREALTRIAELGMERGKLAEAIEIIEKFQATKPQPEVLQTVLLIVGELRLRDYAAAPGARAASLDQAIQALSTFSEQFPTNGLSGKVQQNLGWCWWLKGNALGAPGNAQGRSFWTNSQVAFESAVTKLPESYEQAVAMFKLADVRLQLGDAEGAITDYTALVTRYGEAPQARTNLMERALYQTVRAAISSTNQAAASFAIDRLLKWYPNGPFAERAVLLYGIEVSHQDPSEALRTYENFAQAFPKAQLLPEVQLAIARIFEQQHRWTNAISKYNEWLGTHTNHPAVQRAEYSRAWTTFQAGQDTNAFMLLTNFATRFPNSEFSPLAQWWIADYYFRSGQPAKAELGYKLISENTNWPITRLTYQARMMAGRAAYARQSPTQAAEYFTALWNQTNCPADIRAEALFAYGDTLMTMDGPETNRVANYEEAIRVFTRITEMFPSNTLAALAWGQKANCLLQWAQLSQQYDSASNSFHQVLIAPGSNAKARSIAKVGLAAVLELQSKQNPTSAGALLQGALDHCLDVFYETPKVIYDGEKADPFWTRRAGLDAARLAESLGKWHQAIAIYEGLQEKMPVLRPRMEKAIARAREQEQLGKAQVPLAGKK